MKKVILITISVLSIGMWMMGDLWARGGGGGGRGGGGGGGRGGGGGGGAARSAAGRTPSMSRPATSRPSGGGGSRPGGGGQVSRPQGNRSSLGKLPTPNRPGTGISPRPGGGGSKPSVAGGARPGTGGRPTQGQLNDFLDLGGSGSRPSFGRPATLPGGVGGLVAGNAAYDFLKDRPAGGERPSTLPARPGGGGAARPGPGDLAGSGRPGVDNKLPGRPSERPNRPANGNFRPDRNPNWNQSQNWRQDRWTNVNRDWHNNWNHYDRWFGGDWCQHHPYWHWQPGFNYWGWATWPAVVAWFPWGWSQPVYYNYGNNVYYQDDQVYYGDTPVATAADYADQAEKIAANVLETPPPADSWMPLGVFALMPDGDAAGAEPTLFLQLTVSKTGVIAGTLQDTASDTTKNIEGMVDRESQRAAWTEVGKTRPIMETGIGNLTEDTTPVLVHFADDTTQQWLLVRMDPPPETATSSATGATATPPQ